MSYQIDRECLTVMADVQTITHRRINRQCLTVIARQTITNGQIEKQRLKIITGQTNRDRKIKTTPYVKTNRQTMPLSCF